MDILSHFQILPLMTGFSSGVALLLLGQLAIAVGSYFYIGAGLCCGPRDALMVALCKRFRFVPVGLIRGTIEGSVLFLGWLLGAKVGVGTLIYVFSISFFLQATFSILKFNVRQIEHESLVTSLKNLCFHGGAAS